MRHALWPRGELGQILVCLQEAQSLAQALGDRHRLGWIAAFLAGQFGQIGEPDHALVASQRPLAIAEILGDASITVTAQQYLGQGYHSLGDYRRAEVAAHRHPPQAEQAEAYYRQSLALADELGMRPLVAHCHRGLGTL